MTGASPAGSHLTNDTVDGIWRGGAPVAVPMSGTVACQVRFDPSNGTVTLVTPYETPEPDVAGLQNVRFSAVAGLDGGQLAELTVSVADDLHGVYGLLVDVADEVQGGRLPLAAAVALALARHQRVLASRQQLSTEKQIGLLGELLFLEFLIRQIGDGPAVLAWQGPHAEEHDFSLRTVHVEVKTTSSERRRHVINGIEQLVPQPGVPLSLVSIQLTRVAPEAGRTLPQVVAQVRDLAGGHRAAMDAKLKAAGWNVDDAELYTVSWAMRSKPSAYAVAGEFPAMTPDLLAPVVRSFGRVSNVSYQIDLTDFPVDPLPSPVSLFVDTMER